MAVKSVIAPIQADLFDETASTWSACVVIELIKKAKINRDVIIGRLIAVAALMA